MKEHAGARSDGDSRSPGIAAPALAERSSLSDLATTIPYYREWFTSIVEWMVTRFERYPGYRFLDTKFDVIRGCDFPADDPYRGRDAVFGWIQGRGLESLVFHALWLRRAGAPAGAPTGIADALLARLDPMIVSLHAAITEARERNGGRIHFLMDRSGSGVFPGRHAPEPDRYTFADIFAAKGLFAAASYLDDERGVKEATEYLRRIGASLGEDRFASGQFSLRGRDASTSPAGVGATTPGPRREQGPFMIHLGALGLVAATGSGAWCFDAGLEIVRHILARHVADEAAVTRSGGRLRHYDMWEAVDPEGAPFLDSGRIICDPGHSIEFAGLALEFLSRLKAHPKATTLQIEAANKLSLELPGVLFRNFENGFREPPGGIVKHFDLLTRTEMDSDLPWWSLPEAMRSAMEAHRVVASEEERIRCREIFARCHLALTGSYLRGSDPPLWVQTRSAAGSVVDVIPACSDVDPGYHTNMSIIKALEIIEHA